MATLAFPVRKDGLIVPVVVGLRGEVMAELYSKGMPIPAPVLCRGLVDTGSTVSSVASSILQRLGLGAGIPAETHTASGTAKVGLHWVSLTISDSTQSTEGLTLPTVLVSKLRPGSNASVFG